MPAPVAASFDQLIHGKYDAMFIKTRAVVREADLVAGSFENMIAPVSTVHLRLLADGGHIDAEIDNATGISLNDLLDSEIEITGTESGRFDDKAEHRRPVA